jgi:hypothetical protein
MPKNVYANSIGDVFNSFHGKVQIYKEQRKREGMKAGSEVTDSPLWYMLMGTWTELKPV